MEANLKDMYFSIIGKNDCVEAKYKGSAIGIASLIAEIAQRDENVKNIILLAVIALKIEETGELDEFHEHTANH